MTSEALSRELQAVGKSLSRWRAEAEILFGAGAVLASLWASSLSDAVMRLGKPGRTVAWCITAALLCAVCARIARALVRRRTVQGIAAALEQSFPQLDNRLINYVQFMETGGDDPFKAAYLEPGPPQWRQLDLRAMRDPKTRRRGTLIVGVAIGLLTITGLLMGRTWTTALWRVLLPWSDRAPVSLTRIVSVDPGDITMAQGKGLTLRCTVAGRKGHRVWLDVDPSDSGRSTYDLGSLPGRDEHVFTHRIPQITTGLEYRFRAGDAPFPQWYRVATRPPLVFSRIAITVQPPAYTRLKPRAYDALTGGIEILQDSGVAIEAACNLAATSIAVSVSGQAAVALKAGEGHIFSGNVAAGGGPSMAFTAWDERGESAEATINFKFIPDRLPEFDVQFPKQRALLPPGGFPGIRATVSDDHGLASIKLLRVALGDTGAAGTEVASWTAGGRRALALRWTDPNLAFRRGESLVFRLVAGDNHPLGRQARSAPIIFDTPRPAQTAAGEARDAEEVDKTLGAMIDLQRKNIGRTKLLQDNIEASVGDEWEAVANRQERIRTMAGQLLRDPARPLAGMTATVKSLYMADMLEVVNHLARISGSSDRAEKEQLAVRSLKIEEDILRKLTSADVAVAKARRQRAVAGVVAMLDALVRGQVHVVKSTEVALQQSTRIGQALVERQDGLAGDMSEFQQACGGEALRIEANDKSFADLLRAVAKEAEEREVKADMLRAAEQLEGNAPGAALPLEKRALASLENFRKMLDTWQLAETREGLEDMIAALSGSRERMEKLRKLEEKVIEAMRQIEDFADRTEREEDLIEEELDEVRKQASEALLQVARDMHIYPELSVANELVDDVYSVFEEVSQLEGSEKWTGASAEEMGVLKPEALLDAMKKCEGHMEAMEHWLAEAPDSMKYNMEPFDRDEMPKMALGGLETSVEDLIGDLLKETEELSEAADDSATNLGSPENPLPGWEVAEGPNESFGAQGKSGNQAPDHKEQSGRSNVGRQGQAIGETAAGSGTISEGDKNIENRLTPDPLQSGQVQADGEADENATGGGKQASGTADQLGMPGAGSHTRMDAAAPGAKHGLDALMAKADAAAAKASMMNLRTESLVAAAHHIHQANDAAHAGLPVSQIRAHQKRAVVALRRARTELSSGFAQSIDDSGAAAPLEDVVGSGVDSVPADYRDLVAEYFRSLAGSL